VIEFFGISWGTPFQFLTVILSGGLLAAVLTFVVNNRKISVDAASQLRSHFSKELERVTKRQHDCEEREGMLRERVRELEDYLTGIYRMLVERSAEDVLAMGDAVPEHIRDLANRTLAAQKRKTGPLG
jgi:hypothetical protein